MKYYFSSALRSCHGNHISQLKISISTGVENFYLTNLTPDDFTCEQVPPHNG